MVEAMPQSWGYLLLAVFAAVFIPIGYLSRSDRFDNVEDFLISRESFTAPVAMISLVATWTWSSTVMGSAEGTLNFGAPGFWVYGSIIPISVIVLAVPVLSRVRNRVPEASSFPEYIRLRFPDDWRGTGSHLIFALVAGGQMFFWAVLQIIGVGVVFSVLFGIPHWQGALFTGLIVTTYITFGGLKASIRTDFVQMLAIAALLAIILPWTVLEFGGPSVVHQGLVDAELPKATHLITEDVFYGWFLLSTFSFINYAVINQNVWQRIFASERGKEKYIVAGSAVAWLPIPAAAGLIGMIGIAMGFQGDPSNVMPAVILSTLPIAAAFGFTIIMVAVIFSTIDSCLNSFASIVITDVYKPYVGEPEKVKSDSTLLRRTKIMMVVVGLLISVIGMAEFSIFYFDLAVGAIAIPITWPFVLSALTPRFNRTWGVIGMALGIVAAVLLAFLPAVGLWSSPFELWQGYLIAHLVSGLIPLVGTIFFPEREFTFEQMSERVEAEFSGRTTGGGED